MAWLIFDNLTRHKSEVPHSLEVQSFERFLMIWANACIRSHASLQNRGICYFDIYVCHRNCKYWHGFTGGMLISYKWVNKFMNNLTVT